MGSSDSALCSPSTSCSQLLHVRVWLGRLFGICSPLRSYTVLFTMTHLVIFNWMPDIMNEQLIIGALLGVIFLQRIKFYFGR